MKINVLPKHIANMIAAGEVVERPASAVKELVENSVDAGAKNITVEIKKGGMTYLRITDDGCGIEADEVITAFMRHATSKIKTEEDLNAIYTLGFRGEALASIAAVSEVDIFTKPREKEFGFFASLSAGEVTESGESGCPDGTTITVRNLFFNTPARMKFLKNDATETGHVTDTVNKLILSHPEVSIKLIVNGKMTVKSQGDGKLLSSIYAVFGKDYPKNMTEISYKDDEGIEVYGYIGNSSLTRKDRRQQIFYINGRYITSRLISAALSESFQNTVMVGRFPVAVLNLKVNGNFVDVNVHPTKTEVRFSDDRKVYQAIFWACKNALSSVKYVPAVKIKKNDEYESALKAREIIAKEKNKAGQSEINFLKNTFVEKEEKKEPPMQKEPSEDKIKTANEEYKKIVDEKTADRKIERHIDEGNFFNKNEVMTLKEEPVIEPSYNKSEPLAEKTVLKPDIKEEQNTEQKQIKKYCANRDFYVAGQVFNTYIIVQMNNEMLIIDQHAAQERLYFELFLEQYKNKGISSQQLMLPVTVNLTKTEYVIAVENTEFFDSLGFECEQFGDSSIIVRSVPDVMGDTEIKDCITEIISHIESNKSDIKKTLLEDTLHTMACKRAIKGNHELSKNEMEILCEKVFEFDSVNTCPHGRPIMIKMSKTELEKNFKRIV